MRLRETSEGETMTLLMTKTWNLNRGQSDVLWFGSWARPCEALFSTGVPSINLFDYLERRIYDQE